MKTKIEKVIETNHKVDREKIIEFIKRGAGMGTWHNDKDGYGTSWKLEIERFEL